MHMWMAAGSWIFPTVLVPPMPEILATGNNTMWCYVFKEVIYVIGLQMIGGSLTWLQVDLEAQGYRGWRIWRRYLTGCTTQISVRHDLSGQIKRIKSRLDQISENHKEFKIEHTPGAWTSSITEVAAWYATIIEFELSSEVITDSCMK